MAGIRLLALLEHIDKSLASEHSQWRGAAWIHNAASRARHDGVRNVLIPGIQWELPEDEIVGVMELVSDEEE